MEAPEQGQGQGTQTPPAPQGANGQDQGIQGGANTVLGGTPPAPNEPQGQNGQGTQTPPAPQPEVPEKYEYEIPDTWDEAYTAKVESIAKENKLTNEQMKVFAGFAQKEHQAAMQERQNNMQKWENDLRQEPEFAGENYNQAVQYAKMGLKHIDPKGELFSVLEESGYGSHPAVVKAMYQIGKMLDNDKFAGKGSGKDSTSPIWARMYKTEE